MVLEARGGAWEAGRGGPGGPGGCLGGWPGWSWEPGEGLGGWSGGGPGSPGRAWWRVPGCLYWAIPALAASGNIQPPGYTALPAVQPGYRRHARKQGVPLTRVLSEWQLTDAGVTATVGYSDYEQNRLPCFKE